MQIYLGRNGKQIGPFTLERVQEKLEDGDLRLSDLGWHEGMKDWVPLREMLPGSEAKREEKRRPLREIEPAPYGSRFLAALIDGGVLLLIAVILISISGVSVSAVMMANGATEQQIGETSRSIGRAIGYMLLPIWWLYMAFQESSVSGATPGKKAMGLRVVDSNGERISFLRAFGRNVGRLLCYYSLTIGYLVMFFNERRRGLHDIVAGTRVVRD
jgi:uncharacterized RDD family membrane protein YckC